MVLMPYGVALVLFGAEAFGWLDGRVKLPASARPGLWVATLVATYAIQLAATWFAATHGAAYPSWRFAMPFPVMDLGADYVDAIEAIMLVCGALQSYALVAIYRAKLPTTIAIAGACTMLAISLASPALSSGDVYSNAGYAMLSNPYLPPALPFGGQYAAIDRWWGTPLVPSPYGPLWNLLDRIALGWIPALAGKVLALRVLCSLAFAAMLAVMYRMGMPARILAIAALNPAIYMQFVANAHNDAVMLLVVTVAALFVRRNGALAGAALVVAGLMKLPYVVLALPVLAGIRDLRYRVLVAASAIAATLLLSWWWGGGQYAAALSNHAGDMHGFVGWHTFAVVVALAIVVSAFAGWRRLRTGVWLIPQLGSLYPAFLYPWYLMWSFPYALRRRRVLAYLLIWFPFVGALVNQHLMQVWTLIVVFPLILVFALMPPPRPRIDAAANA